MRSVDPAVLVAALTPGQREVIRLTAAGLTADQIAVLTRQSSPNVRKLRMKAYQCLGVTNNCQASVVACKGGLLDA